MFDNLFGNVDLLQKGLDSSWLKNKVISNNIANVDTPGFKASSVNFESAFKEALESGGSSFSATTTSDKHYQFGDDIKEIEPSIETDNSTSYRADGNNVDIESQNVELAKNSIYYNELIEQESSEFKRLDAAIKG